MAGSIKGDVKRKNSPDEIGEGFSASSPLWDLHAVGMGVLGTAKIPVWVPHLFVSIRNF